MTNKEAKEIIESECYVFDPLNLDRSTMVNTALDVAVEALEKQDRIAQILDDYNLLDTWEVLKMIKEEKSDNPLVEIGVDIGDKDECVISWMPLPKDKDMESKE